MHADRKLSCPLPFSHRQPPQQATTSSSPFSYVDDHSTYPCTATCAASFPATPTSPPQVCRQPPPYARTQCCHTDRQCRTPMPSVCPQLTTASLACPPPQPTHTVLVSTITLTLLVTTTMICTELRDDANVSDFTSPPSPSHFQPQPSPTTTCMHRVGEYYHIHPLDGASTTTLSPLLQHTNDSDGNHRHTSMMTAAVAFGHHLNHHDDHQQHNGYP